jgi:hypothetical protein
MKKSEKIQVAKEIARVEVSLTAIGARYKELREGVGVDLAKEIINLAKDYKRAEFAKVDSLKNDAVEFISGERVLVAVFKDLQKDKAYKALAYKAICKAGTVGELVSAWYPDTINGEPARKVWNADKTQQTWELKAITRSNAAGILVSCIRNLAKAAKHQKSGTTNHKEGEVVVSAK